MKPLTPFPAVLSPGLVTTLRATPGRACHSVTSESPSPREGRYHALDNIFLAGTKHEVRHEVPIAVVFNEELPTEGLFYSGRFDFVVYEVHPDKSQIPVLAIELDGMEHLRDEVVRARDRKKEEICARHGFQLIRVENSYARRYNHIKEILVEYFQGK